MATCLVSGRLVDSQGQPVPGAVVSWRPDAPANSPVFIGQNAISSARDFVLQTDADGRWEVRLEQGLAVIVKIDELGLDRQVVVPARSQATLEEVLNAVI